MSNHAQHTDLNALASELAGDVGNHSSGRTARSILHGDRMRSVVMALDEARELGDHTAPGPAVIQVLRGEIDLRWEDNSVPLAAGDLMAIPDAVHSVHARTAAVFMLTICLPAK